MRIPAMQGARKQISTVGPFRRKGHSTPGEGGFFLTAVQHHTGIVGDRDRRQVDGAAAIRAQPDRCRTAMMIKTLALTLAVAALSFLAHVAPPSCLKNIEAGGRSARHVHSPGCATVAKTASGSGAGLPIRRHSRIAAPIGNPRPPTCCGAGAPTPAPQSSATPA
jgi:hypothetical protein